MAERVREYVAGCVREPKRWCVCVVRTAPQQLFFGYHGEQFLDCFVVRSRTILSALTRAKKECRRRGVCVDTLFLPNMDEGFYHVRWPKMRMWYSGLTWANVEMQGKFDRMVAEHAKGVIPFSDVA